MTLMPACKPISHADIAAVPELLAEYKRECAIPGLGEPNPQWGMYAMMEASGALQAFGVYLDGLVGFAAVLVYTNPHYGKRVAMVESLFVSKASRKHGAGTMLLAKVRDYSRNVACAGILYSAPAGGQLEKILGRRHKRTNSVFFEALG